MTAEKPAICPSCIRHVEELEAELNRLKSMMAHGPFVPVGDVHPQVGIPMLAQIRFQPRYSTHKMLAPVIQYDVVKRTRYEDWEKFRSGEIVQLAPINFPPEMK